jgi:hypothetical protein
MKYSEQGEALVTRMMDANFAASNTPYCYPPNMVNGMREALKVALDEVLEPVTAEERVDHDEVGFIPVVTDGFLVSRRARYALKLTLEERVTICRWVHNPSRYTVLIDGWNPGNHDGFKTLQDAERYRRGLIEELREKE